LQSFVNNQVDLKFADPQRNVSW